MIFVACVVVWFLKSFGWPDGGSAFGMLDFEDPAQTDFSLLARIGNFVAPIFVPLGFGNWQATVASITGLVAKEDVVGTMGVIFGIGSDADSADPGMWSALVTLMPAVCSRMAFLAFNLLCAPCFAAIGAIRREMSSAKWTAFAICYQCVFAYCVALMINQFGLLFSGTGFTVWSAVAIVVAAVFLFLLFRPARKAGTIDQRVAVGV